jgi:glycosyltransferase involved in cell wall biosynthesis
VGSGTPEFPVQVPYLRLGRVDNERLLSLVYSAADVLVLPSLQESFGLVVLEAMACGTPVIGSPVGGMPEMIRPGVTGQLFPVEDVECLRAAVREVLEDPVRHAAMSANCRRVAVEEYSLELHARRYMELYESIIAGREPPLEFGPQDPIEQSGVGAWLSHAV